LAGYPRSQAALDWAATQNDLGNAREKFGERESDTARLNEAIVAYRGSGREDARARSTRLGHDAK
jgi:hypothetical protein